jgi:hypothetical protein
MRFEINPDERCETAAESAALGFLGLMSGISEECWCAGWLIDLEFRLWNVQADSRHGQRIVTERQAQLLRLLSEECEVGGTGKRVRKTTRSSFRSRNGRTLWPRGNNACFADQPHVARYAN